MTTRLITVPVTRFTARDTGGNTFTFSEARLRHIHFLRENDADLRFWVRVAARNIYGKQTQVIFVHKESEI